MLDIASDYTKGIKVFHDTLFHITKVSKHDILKIIKLYFDFSTGSINQKNIPLEIDFGNSNSSVAANATRSCYADSVLVEKDKTVLICGLEWIGNLSQTIDGVLHEGASYRPIIYKYDINSHELSKVFPLGDDGTQWETFLQGDKYSDAPVLVSFDKNNNKLSFLYKTLRTVDGIDIRVYVVVHFSYVSGRIIHTDTLLYSAEDDNGNYSSSMTPHKYVNYDDRDIIIISGTKASNKKLLMIELIS